MQGELRSSAKSEGGCAAKGSGAGALHFGGAGALVLLVYTQLAAETANKFQLRASQETICPECQGEIRGGPQVPVRRKLRPFLGGVYLPLDIWEKELHKQRRIEPVNPECHCVGGSV